MSQKETGAYIELVKEEKAAEAVLGILQEHGLAACLLEGETPQEADFVVCEQNLPTEIKSQLLGSPFVSYIWDEEGTKAFVESITIFSSQEKPSRRLRFNSSKEVV